jgi:hypothetical protein|tara:strand:+ start:2644 stop:2958 length:315 start_codon:yes stop_codon:yes gene_type:complete
MQEEKKYVIVNIEDSNNIDFTQTSYVDADHCRFNYGATKFIVPFRGDKPETLSAYQEYTGDEIRALVHSETNEWYIPSAEVENGSWYDSVKDKIRIYNPFKDWF